QEHDRDRHARRGHCLACLGIQHVGGFRLESRPGVHGFTDRQGHVDHDRRRGARRAGRLPALCQEEITEERYARSMYAPSSVLTLIFSPVPMKGGTCTTRPVSVVAGLNEVVTVAFLISGSVSVTVRTTDGGSSRPIGLSL